MEGKRPQGGRWRCATAAGGGAPVHFRSWEGAEEVQLNEAKLVVVLVGSGVDRGGGLGGSGAVRLRWRRKAARDAARRGAAGRLRRLGLVGGRVMPF
jgi:hypothetical protein